ncbi:PAS domain-containing sensor histidine kinase [Roseomonas stagni]|uniref:histidine kinase n=1 Tax=Falsiroseomonas algicola TaxID=2716930 RepID=A0A6M1LE30_9PROT|nr:PAS domain-containing sensor histidine kinase [Falsiroseomonas algicola]NGM18543.1 PAS domain-containing sensor histidine kinase [Falsiroseomonas algicola]
MATRWRSIGDFFFGRAMTLGLAITAVLLGVATFVLLAGGSPFGPTRPGQIVFVVLANAGVLLMLAASLATRLVRVWAERRRGSAGARLHVRLVMLFGGVAVVPALIVAAFAAIFFNLGIQAWFSDRVRSTLEASLVASRAWLDQHRDEIRVDALAMAADLNRAAAVFLPDNQPAFERLLATQASIRGLTEAVIFEPTLGRVIAAAGFSPGSVIEPPPAWAMETVRQGDVAVVPAENDARVRALAALDIQPGLMLLIGRPLDGGVLEHMRRTELAFQDYDQLDRNRGSLQVTFALIFACAALLVLLAAVLVGLVFANQMARPISRLINAAERVRAGDLATRVEEGTADDELASLSRAFNRMTSQLSAQRGELMEAYRQIDERRRFTETVLSGVSAGVVGLDAEGRINLPNRSASELLGVDLDAGIGLPMARVAPEFAELVQEARAHPDRPRTAEIPIGPPSRRRSLIARIGAETQAGRVTGYVLTFDDITELQSAQRKAAWADVARRIAHEIKNPLTPIQLSAERLKRKYLKEIGSDPETFRSLTDTIVRQVGDIGRMVDEFSAFARMPQPVIRPEDLGQVVREALVLQKAAHPEIDYTTAIPDGLPRLPMDRRLIGQALTNLLQNAADAVASAPREEGERGAITIRLDSFDDGIGVIVDDNGIGLPKGEERARLTEPYVTHKAKGTGLGLAIVKKIMEDHGGRLALEDRPDGGGARALLILPLAAKEAAAPAATTQGERPAMGSVMGTAMGRTDHGA